MNTLKEINTPKEFADILDKNFVLNVPESSGGGRCPYNIAFNSCIKYDQVKHAIPYMKCVEKVVYQPSEEIVWIRKKRDSWMRLQKMNDGRYSFVTAYPPQNFW